MSRFWIHLPQTMKLLMIVYANMEEQKYLIYTHIYIYSLHKVTLTVHRDIFNIHVQVHNGQKGVYDHPSPNHPQRQDKKRPLQCAGNLSLEVVSS